MFNQMNTIKSENSALSSPIIALHGTASKGRQWDQLRTACLNCRSVTSPELPGYSSAPYASGQGLSARIQPMLEDFLQLNQPVHLVGHSFGGALALRLAEMYPEKCLSVTVYEPTSLEVFRSATDTKDIQLLNEIQTLAAKVSNAAPMQAMSLFIDFWMGKGHWQSLPLQVKQQLSQYSAITAQDFQDGLFEAQYESDYQPFKGSIKLLYGEKTMEIAKHVCRLLAEKLPNASVAQLPDLGHMGPIQNPTTVNEAIMLHIEQTECVLIS